MRDLSDFSGLELAVAGVPNDFLHSNSTTKEYGGGVIPQNAKYRYGIKDISSDGKNVKIVRSDGRTITLHPESVKHEAKGYVSAVLGNIGLGKLRTSTFKKIVAMVERLRNDKKAPKS